MLKFIIVIIGVCTFSSISYAQTTSLTTIFAPSASIDTTNANNISSGILGATHLPLPTASSLGGVEANAGVAHQWLSGISTSGVPTLTQPTYSDISGLASAATYSIGVSGATVPLLSTVNTWTLGQTFSAGAVFNGTLSGTGITSLLSPYLLSSTASSTYQLALGFTPYNSTNPSGYQTAANVASTLTAYAPLASPAFTGTPSMATSPLSTDNSTDIATTAFVISKIAAATTGVSSVLGSTGAITLSELITGGVAPAASPTFTGVLTDNGTLIVSGTTTLDNTVFSHGIIIDSTGIRESLTSTYTVPANTSLIRFIQTTTLAASTVTLPTAIADGQPLEFVNYTGDITAFTFSPIVVGWSNGSDFAPNSAVRIRWDATDSTWHREQ